MPRYFNVHTHLPSVAADGIAIHNVLNGFEQMLAYEYVSMGLHPWYLDAAERAFEKLKTAARQEKVLAIGECGLDKLRGAEWSLQELYFRLQIRLANELAKPLIIHCVRAFEEVLQILGEERTVVPVIFHGFRKHQQMADRILSKGYSLSFGAAILQQSAVQQIVSDIPASQFFLETDDATLSIRELYARTAQIRKTDEEAIILQLQQNFYNTFGI